MRTIHHRTARLDRILRAWAVLWLLAFPLFHIHPETDPHHGEAGHVHAVAVHTVFSGDLEGEFDHHRESAEHAPPTDSALALSAEGPHAWKADPELSFSLLNDATDRKLAKPLLTHLLFLAHSLMPVPERLDRPEEDGASTFALTLLVRDVPARAPPSSLLS